MDSILSFIPGPKKSVALIDVAKLKSASVWLVSLASAAQVILNLPSLKHTTKNIFIDMKKTIEHRIKNEYKNYSFSLPLYQ